MGKRELSETTPFELLMLVVMGDIIQQGVTQEDMSVTGAMLAAGTIGLWALGMSWIAFRSRRVERVLDEFLDRVGGALDDLAGGDLVGGVRVQLADAVAHGGCGGIATA